MNRRKFLESAITASFLALLTKKGYSSIMETAWEIKMLNEEIGIFTEKGGTIAFHLSKDGITVVDAQFPDSAPHCIAELKKKEIPFRLLINTHHHTDHTSGNISFKPYISKVLAHENSLKNQRRVARERNSTDREYFPNKTFRNHQSEKDGSETIALNYFGAAHTDGDIVVHFQENNIAHLGDLVFNHTYPYIDRSAGASIKSWIEVLQKVKAYYPDDTTFICGHSGNGFPVTGQKEMISGYENYLKTSFDFVKKQIRSGKTKEQILTIKTIPGYESLKGNGIERTLSAAYEEILAEQ